MSVMMERRRTWTVWLCVGAGDGYRIDTIYTDYYYTYYETNGSHRSFGVLCSPVPIYVATG